MPTEFNLQLLQAISDWQQGGNAKEKHYRGKALKQACQTLDDKYRRCGLLAFRRVALKKTPLWKLLAKGKLPETISAWTVDIDFAKKFKGGVPERGWQGVIVQYLPEPGSVIVNLSMLYASENFLNSIERHRSRIQAFDSGMGKYEGGQSEIVIERNSISPEDIYALGGYSSDPHDVGRLILGRTVSKYEIDWMRRILDKHGQAFGPWWIDGAAKERVLQRIKAQIPKLLEIERSQLARKA